MNSLSDRRDLTNSLSRPGSDCERAAEQENSASDANENDDIQLKPLVHSMKQENPPCDFHFNLRQKETDTAKRSEEKRSVLPQCCTSLHTSDKSFTHTPLDPPLRGERSTCPL